MPKVIFFIFCMYFSVAFAQHQNHSKFRHPIYIELQRQFQQKLETAISKESQSHQQAWLAYQNIWNAKKIVTRTPSPYFGQGELKELLDANSNIKEISLGHYIGVTEYIRRRVAQLKLSRNDFPSLQQEASLAYQEACRNKDWDKLYLLLEEYPVWMYDTNTLIELSDIFLQQGMVTEALGILYRLGSFGIIMNQEQSIYFDMRLALASAFVGDTLVVEEIRQKYTKRMSEKILWKGTATTLEKFFSYLKDEELCSPLYDWSYSYYGNSAHNYLSNSPNLQNKKLKLVSQISNGMMIYSSPIIIGNVLYCYEFFIDRISVIAISLQNFQLLWRSNVSSIAEERYNATFKEHLINFQNLTFYKNYLYVCYRPLYNVPNNLLVCLDVSTGKILWKWPNYETLEEFDNLQFVRRNRPVLSNFNGNLFIDSAFVIQRDKIYIPITIMGGQISHELVCLNAISGDFQWKTFIGAVSPKDYTKERQNFYIPHPSPLAFAYNLIYTCSNYGTIAAIDAITGDIRWLSKYHELFPQKLRLKNRDTRALLPTHPNIIAKHGKLYVLASDVSILYIFNATTGELERYYPEGEYSANILRLSGVDTFGKIWLEEDKKITILQESGTKEIWKSIPISNKNGINLFLTKQFVHCDIGEYLEQIDAMTGKATKIPLFTPLFKNKQAEYLSLLFSEKKQWFIRTGEGIQIYSIEPSQK